MKYIVLEVKDQTGTGDMVREMPVIFGEDMVHADVADAAQTLLLSGAWATRARRQVTCVAAGFLHSTSLGGGCHGESTSLGIRSREGADDELMRAHDYYRGVKL